MESSIELVILRFLAPLLFLPLGHRVRFQTFSSLPLWLYFAVWKSAFVCIVAGKGSLSSRQTSPQRLHSSLTPSRQFVAFQVRSLRSAPVARPCSLLLLSTFYCCLFCLRRPGRLWGQVVRDIHHCACCDVDKLERLAHGFRHPIRE